PSGWRVVQDIAASASSILSQRTVLRRRFRETIPDCTLQCGPTKQGLSTCLAERPSLCVSSIRLDSRAAKYALGSAKDADARPESGGGIRSYLRGVPNAAAVLRGPLVGRHLMRAPTVTDVRG